MAYDIIIRNGTVVDGTGAPGRQADVAVRGDRIAEITDLDDGGIDATATREIDAEGRLVTPGFVDIHTHLDAQLAWDPIGTSSCWHGITSQVMGNCGVTFAPCRPEDRGVLAEMMESVEDIPRAAILDLLSWDWETYGEYYDAIDRLPKGANTGGLVGHSAVRTYVMGERGLDEAPATVETALATGAISPYDTLVQSYSARYGLDWRLQHAPGPADVSAPDGPGAPDVLVVAARQSEGGGLPTLAALARRHPGAVRIQLMVPDSSQDLLDVLSNSHRMLNEPLEALALIEAVESVAELRELLEDPRARSPA